MTTLTTARLDQFEREMEGPYFSNGRVGFDITEAKELVRLARLGLGYEAGVEARGGEKLYIVTCKAATDAWVYRDFESAEKRSLRMGRHNFGGEGFWDVTEVIVTRVMREDGLTLPFVDTSAKVK